MICLSKTPQKCHQQGAARAFPASARKAVQESSSEASLRRALRAKESSKAWSPGRWSSGYNADDFYGLWHYMALQPYDGDYSGYLVVI